MKWLVTAFEPFDQANSNSSLIVLDHLRKLNWESKVHFHGPVPVTFSGAWANIEAALLKCPWVDGVLALGQAESRSRINLERLAVNVIDARIPDNEGSQPVISKIDDGPDVYWSPIPWQDLESSPAWERSYSAGTFVCNTVMYQGLSWAKRNGKFAGFVHVPVLASQSDPKFASYARMTDATATAALERILKFIVAL